MRGGGSVHRFYYALQTQRLDKFVSPGKMHRVRLNFNLLLEKEGREEKNSAKIQGESR